MKLHIKIIKVITVFFCLFSFSVCNVIGKENNGAGKKMKHGFRKLPSGIEYKIINAKGGRKPIVDDHIEMHIHVHIGDSTIFDSRKMNNDLPVPFRISAAKYAGDPVEGFMLMGAGDSAVIKIPVDSMIKAGNQLLPNMQAGDMVEYNVVLLSVLSDKEKHIDDSIKAAKQTIIDDKLLTDYFNRNKIKPVKTISGMYYTVINDGSGSKPVIGDTVSVNYTGKLITGKVFDSNTDPEFHHVEPFKFAVGTGSVIKGWDEGLQLMKTGARVILYIPSNLAYGSQDRSPQIPANSIMIFDIDLLKIIK